MNTPLPTEMNELIGRDEIRLKIQERYAAEQRGELMDQKQVRLDRKRKHGFVRRSMVGAKLMAPE
jgi:hypothetical protein